MLPRILSFRSRRDVINELRKINVDRYGITIMAPKADHYLIRLPKVSCIAANILKQEMLSLGGDVAISRHSITGKDKYTDCLIMGNATQLYRFVSKLRLQPFKLNEIAQDLKNSINEYVKESFTFKCRNYALKTATKTHVMGIVNVTVDSFSGDGLLQKQIKKKELKNIIFKKAEQLIKQGADIIDVGAESTRPGAKPVSAKKEIMLIKSFLKEMVREFKVPISVDTYKPAVARVALDLGASIINDITGLRNSAMRSLIARYHAGVIIMHMQGTPRTMQRNPRYNCVVEEIITFLKHSLKRAIESGIRSDAIILDPGIGFGKTLEHNLEILRNMKEFKVLGRPLLLGVSRKSFIGALLGRQPEERLFGTAASIALAIKEGVDFVRVHDVAQMRDVAKICDVICKKRRK